MEEIIVYSKISLIIILNLNFNLQVQKPLIKEFLKMLNKTYKDKLKEDKNWVQNYHHHGFRISTKSKPKGYHQVKLLYLDQEKH